ncbi:hypothetical protein BJP39_17205 [Streptomyces sp. CC77]|nr:hypothetical protein BJP39_17205 [Streptomyces sp. CC77]
MIENPEHAEPRPGAGRPAVRRPLRMCVKCSRMTDTPVLVVEIHSASGPGFTVYACHGCAPHYGAHPERLVERPGTGGAG